MDDKQEDIQDAEIVEEATETPSSTAAATDQATGKIHDIVLYGLFKEEWKKMRLKIIKEINKKIKQNEGF